LIADMTIYDIEFGFDKSVFDKFFGDYYSSSYHAETSMMTLHFCVKIRNEAMLDKGQWIPGNYSIYKIGVSCPSGIYQFFDI
jgi:hypothetical protein